MARLSRRAMLLGGGAVGAAALAAGGYWWMGRLPSTAEITAAYTTPVPVPEGALTVFHLGHSLVGRDMPAMLAQLAQAAGFTDHTYNSQLGWGTSLREHWYPEMPINGYESENDHPQYRPALEAVGSGDYDAVIVTEMVELLDALKYHDSGDYVAQWADLARGANPDTQVYLYETWHALDDPRGFLERLDADLPALWEGRLLAHDLRSAPARPIRIIPAGQVMGRVVRAIEAAPLPGLARREDLFALTPEGTQDQIHMNDIGAYLVAVTHFAVLYHQSPLGLPAQLLRVDGTPATAPSPEAAALIQSLAWEVVTAYPKTGVVG